MVRFALPLFSIAEVRSEHRRMLRALGATGDALRVPEVESGHAEMNAQAVRVPWLPGARTPP